MNENTASQWIPNRVLLLLSQANKASRDRLSGILRYNLRTKWNLVTVDASRHDTTVRSLSRLIREWRPDGIIATPAGLRLALSATAKLPPRHRPVLVGFEPPSSDDRRLHGVVRIDDAAVVRAATETLCRRGVRNLGFASLLNSLDDQHVAQRVHAIRREARERGCTCSVFVNAPKTRTPNVSRFAEWLAELPKPCGVMLFNDQAALPAYAACRQAGLSIPAQVFFIGVDNDTTICENLDPPLSSVLPDFEGAGFLAAERLDACLRNNRAFVRRFRSFAVKSVVERGSTIDVSGASRYVFRAREYLDLNPDGRLTVAKLAAELNLSPRLLEMHFARSVGHTIRQEMLDRRFQRLTNLLLTTTRPIYELIDLCGWSSISSAKRLFRKRYGCAIQDYRKGLAPSPENG